MKSLMQDFPLTIDALFHRGEQYFGHKTITSVYADGPVQVPYAEWAQEVRKLAGALEKLGVSPGGTVGSFAWNSARHMSLYFAVPASARVLHCVNIRLFPDQIEYIINHGADEVLFVDKSLLPVLQPLLPRCKAVRHVVVMDDGSDVAIDGFTGVTVHDYDELVSGATPIQFPAKDENDAALMCYTSGTTGDPKGVVYSHRSIYLHSMAASAVGTLGINESDRILTLVPMFHANAWGIPFAAVAQGADLIFPGSDLSGPRIADLMEKYQVTLAAGVPTLWMSALPYLKGKDLSSLRLIACGGAAVPKALSENYRKLLGFPIQQAWGMTETISLGAVGRLDGDHTMLTDEERAHLRTGIGRSVLGVEARLVEPGTLIPSPRDGATHGELQIRGPWIASGYHGEIPDRSAITEDGWLKTGDVATMDARGWINLVDRTKDLIKSGGEWIAPADLENHLTDFEGVAEAAVIGVPHPRWSERPLALVVPADGSNLDPDDLRAQLAGVLAKWQLPDTILLVDSLPKTGVGKIAKMELRKTYQDAYVDAS